MEWTASSIFARVATFAMQTLVKTSIEHVFTLLRPARENNTVRELDLWYRQNAGESDEEKQRRIKYGEITIAEETLQADERKRQREENVARLAQIAIDLEAMELEAERQVKEAGEREKQIEDERRKNEQEARLVGEGIKQREERAVLMEIALAEIMREQERQINTAAEERKRVDDEKKLKEEVAREAKEKKEVEDEEKRVEEERQAEERRRKYKEHLEQYFRITKGFEVPRTVQQSIRGNERMGAEVEERTIGEEMEEVDMVELALEDATLRAIIELENIAIADKARADEAMMEIQRADDRDRRIEEEEREVAERKRAEEEEERRIEMEERTEQNKIYARNVAQYMEIVEKERKANEEATERRRIEDEKIRMEEVARQEEERRKVEVEKRAAEREKSIVDKRVKKADEELDEKRRELEERFRKVANGIQPVVWPSEEEWRWVKERVQYSSEKFTFAVAGCAGSGKSSLINVFLNLPNNHPNAAPTGPVETTFEITRYPDPSNQPPRKWTVWYDVPGAGTQNIPSWQYFNQQCLFIMDVVIVVVGDRFTQTDLEILKNCRLYSIPSFIVRSKADQHIKNGMISCGWESGDDDDEDLRQKCRKDYITKTRQSVEDQLRQAAMPPQKVYIVSCSKAFRAEYSAFIVGSEKSSGRGRGRFVDEKELIQDLVITAGKRRYGISEDSGLDQQERTVAGPSITKDGEMERPKWRCPKCPQQEFRSESALQNHFDSAFHHGGSQPAVEENQPAPAAAQTPATLPLGSTNMIQKKNFMDMIEEIDIRIQATQLLVLSQTGTTATQINSLLKSLVPNGVRCYACIGETSTRTQGSILASGQHVVSATPGSISLMIRQRSFWVGQIKILVLNTEDELLGSSQDMQTVHRYLRPGTWVIRGIVEV